MLGLDDYGSDSDTDQRNSPRLVSQGSRSAKKTQRPPKKIAIPIPAIKVSPDDEDERPVKRQKTGAGASSLISILPNPKQTNLPAGGAKGSALEFRTRTSVEDEKISPVTTDDIPEHFTSTLFRPSSLAKGKKNVSIEEPGINHLGKPPMQTALPIPSVDFFRLGGFDLFCYF